MAHFKNIRMTRIVLVLAFFLLSGSLQAQRLEIGVYTEPQFAWLSSDEGRIINNGSILNLNTGIEFNIFFMPNYAFTFGVSVNNQGGKLIYSDTTDFQQLNSVLEIPGGSSVKHNLQYLGVPLGLKLKSEEMGYTTFYVYGGLSPMFNMKASTSSEQIPLDRANIKPEINLFSLNYFFEAGIEYRLAGNTAVIVGFKWSSGFNDVTTNDYANNNLYSAGLHIGVVF